VKKGYQSYGVGESKPPSNTFSINSPEKKTKHNRSSSLSKRNHGFFKQKSMMPNIDDNDKQIFQNIMIDLEDIEEVDKINEI